MNLNYNDSIDTTETPDILSSSPDSRIDSRIDSAMEALNDQRLLRKKIVNIQQNTQLTQAEKAQLVQVIYSINS